MISRLPHDSNIGVAGALKLETHILPQWGT
jgi:hypothetical protein